MLLSEKRDEFRNGRITHAPCLHSIMNDCNASWQYIKLSLQSARAQTFHLLASMQDNGPFGRSGKRNLMHWESRHLSQSPECMLRQRKSERLSALLRDEPPIGRIPGPLNLRNRHCTWSYAPSTPCFQSYVQKFSNIPVLQDPFSVPLDLTTSAWQNPFSTVPNNCVTSLHHSSVDLNWESLILMECSLQQHLHVTQRSHRQMNEQSRQIQFVRDVIAINTSTIISKSVGRQCVSSFRPCDFCLIFYELQREYISSAWNCCEERMAEWGTLPAIHRT